MDKAATVDILLLCVCERVYGCLYYFQVTREEFYIVDIKMHSNSKISTFIDEYTHVQMVNSDR